MLCSGRLIGSLVLAFKSFEAMKKLSFTVGNIVRKRKRQNGDRAGGNSRKCHVALDFWSVFLFRRSYCS